MTHRTLQGFVVGTVGIAVMAIAIGIYDLRVGVMAGVFGAIAIIAAAVWSAHRGRHTPWTRAVAQLAPDHALVLWKPGCFYCERLMLQLRRNPDVTWVNVWRDDEAQARVCALNGGDELTPTVLIGDDVLRNPTARELTERLLGSR